MGLQLYMAQHDWVAIRSADEWLDIPLNDSETRALKHFMQRHIPDEVHEAARVLMYGPSRIYVHRTDTQVFLFAGAHLYIIAAKKPGAMELLQIEAIRALAIEVALDWPIKTVPLLRKVLTDVEK